MGCPVSASSRALRRCPQRARSSVSVPLQPAMTSESLPVRSTAHRGVRASQSERSRSATLRHHTSPLGSFGGRRLQARCCRRRSWRRSPAGRGAHGGRGRRPVRRRRSRYPFIAILEGEVAILDGAGNEIVRHGPSRFLGELNLLSGQTVFVTAVVTEPLRYIAVDRDVLRGLLFEDGPLSDLVLSTFIARREALQPVAGLGLEIVGPRSSEATMRMLDFARSNRLPFTWRSDERRPHGRAEPAARAAAGRRGAARTVDRPAVARARHRPRARAAGGGRPAGRRRRPGRARRRGLRRLRGPRHAGRREHRARRTGRARRAGSRTTSASRPASPAPSSRAARSPRRGSSARARRRRTGRSSLEPGDGRHVVRLEEDHEIAARAVLLATGAEYRRLPVDGLADYEGLSVFYAAGPPEAQLCGASRVGVVGGGNSAGQAAVWLARGGALVTLLHRRGGPARDDVGLPDPRARALRRRRPRPQRDRRAARSTTGTSRPSR